MRAVHAHAFADIDGRLRFFDFGDASIAHPFGSIHGQFVYGWLEELLGPDVI